MTDSTPIYASTNRRRYAQKPSHRTPFMRRYSYTESLVHREIFTHRCLHTHTEAFTKKMHRNCYTPMLCTKMFLLTARKPAQRFCVFCVVICWVGWGGGGVITSCVYVIIDFLRWIRFMLRCTFLLYFGDQTSCYVAHFCCTSVNTLHVTLHTSVVLRWTHFMWRNAKPSKKRNVFWGCSTCIFELPLQ